MYPCSHGRSPKIPKTGQVDRSVLPIRKLYPLLWLVALITWPCINYCMTLVLHRPSTPISCVFGAERGGGMQCSLSGTHTHTSSGTSRQVGILLDGRMFWNLFWNTAQLFQNSHAVTWLHVATCSVIITLITLPWLSHFKIVTSWNTHRHWNTINSPALNQA